MIDKRGGLMRGGKMALAVVAPILTAMILVAAARGAPAYAGSTGYYSRGKLTDGVALGYYETGLLKLFPERDRGYGNVVTIDLLRELGVAYEQTFRVAVASTGHVYERLHVGDISKAGGGRISLHVSHQNGLDVDVGYFRADGRESESFDERFVVKQEVSANFDVERNWWVMSWLAATGRIERILVDKRIKRLFCDAFQGQSEAAGETLHLLSPAPKHDDHFHVRLICPEGETKCKNARRSLKAGDGCDQLGT